jgi:hypothetical protein
MKVRWKGLGLVVVLAAILVTVFGSQANAKRERALATLEIMGFGPGDEIANVRASTIRAAHLTTRSFSRRLRRETSRTSSTSIG